MIGKGWASLPTTRDSYLGSDESTHGSFISPTLFRKVDFGDRDKKVLNKYLEKDRLQVSVNPSKVSFFSLALPPSLPCFCQTHQLHTTLQGLAKATEIPGEDKISSLLLGP